MEHGTERFKAGPPPMDRQKFEKFEPTTTKIQMWNPANKLIARLHELKIFQSPVDEIRGTSGVLSQKLLPTKYTNLGQKLAQQRIQICAKSWYQQRIKICAQNWYQQKKMFAKNWCNQRTQICAKNWYQQRIKV